jgi:biotin carboxylase
MKDGKPVILFIHSGGYWKRDCFTLARNLGYHTVCAEAETFDLAELSGHADAAFHARIYEPAALLSDISAGLAGCGIERPDGVTTFFELVVEQTAEIAKRYSLTAIHGDAAHRARNKFDMRKSIADPFFDNAFQRVATQRDVCDFFQQNGGAAIVLKPCDLGASTGVIRIVNYGEIANAWTEATDALRKFVGLYGYSTPNGLMVELMMPMGSREYNVDLFVNNGHPYVIGIAEKQGLYDGPSFQENAYVFPPEHLSADEQRAIEREARRAVSAVGVTSGAVHLEAKMIPDGSGGRRPCVIELGARCAGDLEMPALKFHRNGIVDLRTLVLEQTVDRLSKENLEAARLCDEGLAPSVPIAVCVKYADSPGTLLSDIGIPEIVARSCHVVEAMFEAKKGYRIDLPENDYLGAVICEGLTPHGALENVNTAIAHIPVEIDGKHHPHTRALPPYERLSDLHEHFL